MNMTAGFMRVAGISLVFLKLNHRLMRIVFMQEMLAVRRELLDYQRHEMEVHPDSPRLSRGLPTLEEENQKIKFKAARTRSSMDSALLTRF